MKNFLFWFTENDQSKNGTDEDAKTDEKINSNGQTNGNMMTNGDDSMLATISTPLSTNSKQVPPKAMVKPQVLTHVIEGFVIQEGNFPLFTVEDCQNN